MASDDGFREIQLSGKQLVFLFMATTIVAVVIFLCGVMVGRGVKSPGVAAAAVPAATVPTPDPQPLTDNQAVPKSEQAAPASAAGAPDVQPAANSPAEGAKPADDKKAAAAAEPPPAVPDEAPTTSAAPAAAAGAANEPSGDGWIVQVTALADQAQCNAIAARLVAKGYAAYVTPPPPGGGVYRVRVGKFKERRAADNVKRRLEKEEQLKPWITR